MFYSTGFTNSVEDLDTYTTEGYVCTKFRYVMESNYDNDPEVGPVVMSTGGMNDADYPVFRLADTYLMLAECELKGVKDCNGLKYYNDVRKRAGLATVGSYSPPTSSTSASASSTGRATAAPTSSASASSPAANTSGAGRAANPQALPSPPSATSTASPTST